MRPGLVEQKVCDYIVTFYLLKTLEWDRQRLQGLKLSRIWVDVFEHLSLQVEKEHGQIRNMLRNKGCRILIQEVTASRDVHVMYVFRGYEHHCVMLSAVLKGKCEEKLRLMLNGQRTAT